jgi:hypothetical protein
VLLKLYYRGEVLGRGIKTRAAAFTFPGLKLPEFEDF